MLQLSPCARLSSALLFASVSVLLLAAPALAAPALAAPGDTQRIERLLVGGRFWSVFIPAARPPSTATLAELDGPSRGTPATTH